VFDFGAIILLFSFFLRFNVLILQLGMCVID